VAERASAASGGRRNLIHSRTHSLTSGDCASSSPRWDPRRIGASESAQRNSLACGRGSDRPARLDQNRRKGTKEQTPRVWGGGDAGPETVSAGRYQNSSTRRKGRTTGVVKTERNGTEHNTTQQSGREGGGKEKWQPRRTQRCSRRC